MCEARYPNKSCVPPVWTRNAVAYLERAAEMISGPEISDIASATANEDGVRDRGSRRRVVEFAPTPGEKHMDGLKAVRNRPTVQQSLGILSALVLLGLGAVTALLVALSFFPFVAVFAAFALLSLPAICMAVLVIYFRRRQFERLWNFLGAWAVFLLPFYSVLVIGVVGLFSAGWSLIIGSIVFVWPQYQLIRLKGKPDVVISPKILNCLTVIFSPVFSYFPIVAEVHRKRPSIVTDDEVQPRERVLYCYHPHGMYAFGIFSMIFPELAGISLPRRAVVGVANALLRLPIVGSVVASLGFVSASKECLQHVIDTTSYDLAVVPGGIAEMTQQSDYPNEEILYLKHRKGFVRFALENGLSLCPVYGFGETQTFHPVRWGRRICQTLSRRFKVALQPFYGRWGVTLIPFQEPITVVFGDHIQCPHIPDPSDEVVDRIHAAYIDAVVRLYLKHRSRFPKFAKRDLIVL